MQFMYLVVVLAGWFGGIQILGWVVVYKTNVTYTFTIKRSLAVDHLTFCRRAYPCCRLVPLLVSTC